MVIKVVIDDDVNLGVGSGVCIYFLKEMAIRQIILLCRGESKVQASFMCVYASKIDA